MTAAIRRWRQADEAILMLQDTLNRVAPDELDQCPASGCCGCGAWMCDVRTPANPPDYPRGESYCWSCVDRIGITGFTVLPGRNR